MSASSTQPDAVELYLMHLNAALPDFPRAERDEFLREIRAHIFEKLRQGGPVPAALAALGDPEELARQVRAERSLVQSSRSWSPWVLMRAVARWGLSGVQGFLVFVLALIGYSLAACFYITAVLKPIFPRNIGFYVSNHNFTIAAWPAPEGHEILGPYYTLVAIVLGFLLVAGTSFLLRRVMRKFAVVRAWLR
jgi:uncharacterized membrane protein